MGRSEWERLIFDHKIIFARVQVLSIEVMRLAAKIFQGLGLKAVQDIFDDVKLITLLI